MAITSEIIKCPLTEYDLLPFMQQFGGTDTSPNREEFWTSAKKYTDSSWPGGKPPKGMSVVYFAGSGSTDYLTETNAIVTALISSGFTVYSHLRYQTTTPHPDVSSNPYSGYGQVANPNMMGGNFFTEALNVKAALTAIKETDSQPKILLSHSRGSAGVLGYLGLPEEFKISEDNIHGALIMSPAAAGNGTEHWNGVTRIMSSMNILFDGLKSMPDNSTIVLWGNNDTYTPPAMQHRIRYSMSKENKTHLISVGDLGHNWMSSGTVAIMMRHINSIYTRSKPILNSGDFSVPGRGF